MENLTLAAPSVSPLSGSFRSAPAASLGSSPLQPSASNHLSLLPRAPRLLQLLFYPPDRGAPRGTERVRGAGGWLSCYCLTLSTSSGTWCTTSTCSFTGGCTPSTARVYISPFSWSAEQLSIPELMAVGFWGNLDPVLLGCHPLTTWCVTVFSIWMSVEDHIGYDLPWTLNRVVPFGLLGGAPAHDMHHQKPGCNFAPFFRHWDRIFGTAAPF